MLVSPFLDNIQTSEFDLKILERKFMSALFRANWLVDYYHLNKYVEAIFNEKEACQNSFTANYYSGLFKYLC